MLPCQFNAFHEPTILAFLISGKSSCHAGLFHGTATTLGVYAYIDVLRKLILGLQNLLKMGTLGE
jgi:hypothetical protein